MKSVVTGLVGAALISGVIAVGSLSAHHGRGNTYDGSQEHSVTGVVTELSWRNPHVSLYVESKDAGGEITTWGFEASNVSTMSREGWNRNIVRPGQEVTVTFNPSRSGAPNGVLRTILLADGTEIRARGNANTLD